MARVARLESGHASALDEAMLGLHADLAARFAQQHHDDGYRFARIMAQLGRILDGLPGPGSRQEITLYLVGLIRWLDTDPWPRHSQLGGPVLNPAAVERKLRVTVQTEKTEKLELDADELARQRSRLAVLGGAGSGKTWFARRTARRCAEAALDALAAGTSLDDVELPLYTTCSFHVRTPGNVRQAVVAAALEQIGDLGGSRITAAVRDFFTERNAPTLLVIDSLDEARDPDNRHRQVDTLPWRIVLITRPAAWNKQIGIDPANPSHAVGELLPLAYPGDVVPLITAWFAHDSARGEDLASQIARRPDLQQASTVLLILAFYCIVGGSSPLPEFRHDLHSLPFSRRTLQLPSKCA
jgi:hypothetical protein